jgi:parvulin-like peptidyl-prolyl isomerase
MSKDRSTAGWLAVLLLAILLTACATDSDADRSAASGERPAVVVATVAPGQELPTLTPTVAPPTATPSPTPPAPLAAQVNGQYVFLADYEQRVAQYEQAWVQQGIDPNTGEGQADLAQARKDVLEGLIDAVLIEQGGAALGITLTDEELEAQIEADIAAGGGQAAFDEWLQAVGQDRDDYKEMLRQSLLSQRVMEAVTSEVGAEAEQVHARHIVVESEEAAREILTMLQQGADFAALAREYSIDQATKDNGGDLGWFPRKLVAPELENAAFALQPGQVGEMVRLGEEVHIVQVVERETARPLAPEVQLDLRLAIFDQWLAELRASAAIVRFVAE